jgi:hypothetical protein
MLASRVLAARMPILKLAEEARSKLYKLKKHRDEIVFVM